MKVLFFGEVRRILDKDSIEIDFKGSIGDLKSFLEEKFPEIKDTLSNCAFAVNLEYKKLDYTLNGNETVAVIPPVEGG